MIAIREKDGFLDRFTEVRRLAIMFMNVARLLLELFNLSFFRLRPAFECVELVIALFFRLFNLFLFVFRIAFACVALLLALFLSLLSVVVA